ncbi:MAG: outer membrane protein assembly factor BamA [Candidatus Hydrothermales bacterium]
MLKLILIFLTLKVKYILKDIKVEGNINVSTDFIVNTSGFKKGEYLSEEDVKEALKKLYSTKNFKNISIDLLKEEKENEVIALIKVEEFPRVEGIKIEGTRKIKDKEIIEKITLLKGSPLSGSDIKESENKIVSLYREKGFSGTKVETELIKTKKEGFVDVLFKVHEGKKAKIKEIDIIGNENFPDKKIEILLRNREKKWYRKAVFREEYFEEDLPKIEDFYKNNGFIDIKVDSYKVNPEGDWLYIKIFLTEGKKFYFGDYRFEGNNFFDEGTLSKKLKLKKGEIFSLKKFIESIQEIQGLYADSGFLLVKVIPEEKRRSEIKRENLDLNVDTLFVIFHIKEGLPCYVNKINIAGNQRTREYVIRRELDIFPGDKFNRQKVIKSLRDLYFLNYFEKVDFSFEILEDSKRVDLIFKVKDKPTGTLQAGGSYSMVQKGSLILSVSENNLFGRGQQVSLSLELGMYRQNIRFNFTEPWMFQRHYLFGFDVHHYIDVFPDEYSVQKTGFSLSFARPYDVNEYIWTSTRYELDRNKVFDFSARYDPVDVYDLRKEKWPKIVSRTINAIYFDSRDRKFNTRKGMRSEYKVTLSGGIFLGDEHFHRHVISYSYYKPLLKEKIVPTFNVKLGFIYPYKKTKPIPVYEYFRPGGVQFTDFVVRGYEERTIGYKSQGVVIGGTAAFAFNFELRFVVNDQIYFSIFYDLGNAFLKPYNMEREIKRIFEEKRVRLKRGVGVGVRMEIPMLGIVGVDLAYGFDKLEKGFIPHFVLGFPLW